MEALFKKLSENLEDTHSRHRIAKTFSDMGLLSLPDWRLMITDDDIAHWKREKEILERTQDAKVLNLTDRELYNITFYNEVFYRIEARYYYPKTEYPKCSPYDFILTKS